MKEKFFNRLTTAAVIILIFAIIFELNRLMPLHRDDYDYSMIWGTSEHIKSPADIFESMRQHYFLHGGRMVTVFCLDLFLWLGKFPFDVANALIFTALIVLIYIHARRELKIDEAGILAVVGLLAWLSLPHFGEVAVWKSGSTVYLWSAVIVAIFLLPYNLALARTKTFDNKIFLPVMFLLGILAGCSVENLAVTVTIFSGAIIFYCSREKILSSWMLSGFFGNILGLVIIIAAPGNYVRYDDQSNGKGILSHIGNQIAGNAEMILYLLPVILILICAFGILRGGKEVMKSKTAFLPIFAVISVFVISYFNDSFITRMVHDFFVEVIFPLKPPSEKFIERFDNFMAKSEEFIIYLLIIFSIYRALINSFVADKKIRLQQILKTFPQVRYAAFLFALAIFNNFVMIAAPTFPARATFSSVVMILIGTVAIIRIPIVQEKFSTWRAGFILKCGAFFLGGFTIISALIVTNDLNLYNEVRINKIKQASATGRQVIKFDSIPLKNRALRHVFFVDFDNGVTKSGLCKYYGLRDIEIKNRGANE